MRKEREERDEKGERRSECEMCTVGEREREK